MKNSILVIWVCVALTLLFFPKPGFSQTPDELKSLRKEIEELKESEKAIQKDLQEIKNVLRARGLIEDDPQNLFINISGRPIKGNPNARLVLIEFSEYQ